jgi:hypothetical protein
MTTLGIPRYSVAKCSITRAVSLNPNRAYNSLSAAYTDRCTVTSLQHVRPTDPTLNPKNITLGLTLFIDKRTLGPMKSCASECVELGLKRPYLLLIALI